MITFDEFKKLDIRIGKVITVEKVENTDKLLKLVFDMGEGETRQVVSAIAEFYPEFEKLVGKEMPVLLNLEPRVIRGIESQGMILAADVDGTAVLLHPDREIPPGSIIK